MRASSLRRAASLLPTVMLAAIHLRIHRQRAREQQMHLAQSCSLSAERLRALPSARRRSEWAYLNDRDFWSTGTIVARTGYRDTNAFYGYEQQYILCIAVSQTPLRIPAASGASYATAKNMIEMARAAAASSEVYHHHEQNNIPGNDLSHNGTRTVYWQKVYEKGLCR